MPGPGVSAIARERVAPRNAADRACPAPTYYIIGKLHKPIVTKLLNLQKNRENLLTVRKTVL